MKSLDAAVAVARSTGALLTVDLMVLLIVTSNVGKF